MRSYEGGKDKKCKRISGTTKVEEIANKVEEGRLKKNISAEPESRPTELAHDGETRAHHLVPVSRPVIGYRHHHVDQGRRELLRRHMQDLADQSQ